MSDPQGHYGTIHIMEEEMRAAEQGVFGPKSGAKAEPVPQNKMAKAPENKAAPAKRKAK